MNCLRRLFRCCLNSQDPSDEIGNVDTKDTSGSPEVGSSGSVAGIGNNENEYAEYGLPSPPRGENLQSLELAKKHMIKDGFRKYTKSKNRGKDKTKVLFFLYGRGFYINESKKERVEKVNLIIDDDKAVKRAVRLVTHDGDRDITAKQEEVYKALCKTLEVYFAQEGAFGISVPSPSVLVNYFRFQKQGNCFLLAPCVFISYLRQQKGIADDQGPLDLTRYVRHAFDDDKLYRYLVKDEGGSTVSELTSILRSLSPDKNANLESPIIDSLNKKASDFALERRLELAGPGIVSNFKVSKGFENSVYNLECVGYMSVHNPKRPHTKGTFVELETADNANGDRQPQYEVTLAQYLETHTSPKRLNFDSSESKDDVSKSEENGVENEGDAEENEEGKNANEDSVQDGKGGNPETHAMVVIGGRRKKNKLFFLLQNWWNGMQLVEVSAEYLKSRGAQIHFAGESFGFSPTRKDQGYSLNNAALFADANYFDRAEQTVGGLSPPTLDRASHCTPEP